MRQSSRIYFVGKDHKDIYFQGHYHDKMYIGSKLVWEKLKGGEYIFDFEFKYYEEEEGYYLTAIGYPLDLKGSSVSIPVKSVRMADVFGSDYRGGFSDNFFVTAGKSEYVFITEDDGTYTIRRFKGGKVTDTITFTVDSGEDYYYRDFHSWFSADGQYNFYLISKKTKGELGGYDYFVYTIKGSAYSKQTFTIDTFCDKEIFSQNDGNQRKYIYCHDAYYYDAEKESLILGLMCQSVHGEEVTVKDELTVDYMQSAQYEGFVKLKGSSYEKLSEVVNIYESVFTPSTIIKTCPFKSDGVPIYGNGKYEEYYEDEGRYLGEQGDGTKKPYWDFMSEKGIIKMATKQNTYTDATACPDFIPYVKNAIKAKVLEAGREKYLFIPLDELLNAIDCEAFYHGYHDTSEKWMALLYSFYLVKFGSALPACYYNEGKSFTGYYNKTLNTMYILNIPVTPEIYFLSEYRWVSLDTNDGPRTLDYYFVHIFQTIKDGYKNIKDLKDNSPFDIGISFSGSDKLNIKTTPTGGNISSQEIAFGGYTIPEYFYTLNNIKDVKQYNGNYYFYANSTVNLLNTGASIGLNYTTNIYIDTEDNLRKEAAADENG